MVSLRYEYWDENVRPWESDEYDTAIDAFLDGKALLESDFVADIRFHKNALPDASERTLLFMSIWITFFGRRAISYTLRDLKIELERYLTPMSVVGYPELTEGLRVIRQRQISAVFALLNLQRSA